MTILAITGGRVARSGRFLKSLVPMAPKSVATLPSTMSISTAPVRKLLIRHPIKSPGMAAGKKMGNTQSASEKRT